MCGKYGGEYGLPGSREIATLPKRDPCAIDLFIAAR
jgi:hypothetical protein